MKFLLPQVKDVIDQYKDYLNVTKVQVDTPSGPVVISMDDYRAGVDLPAACYFGHAQREVIYRAIDGERQHQIDKYGADKQQSIPGFLLIIENELNEAKLGWTKNLTGRHSVMHEILQIAATAVAAMEKYGTSGSAKATDDIPVA